MLGLENSTDSYLLGGVKVFLFAKFSLSPSLSSLSLL